MGDWLKRLVLVLLLSGLAFAASSTPPSSPSPPPAPAPIINIDLGPLIAAVTALPNQIISGFFTYVVAGLSSMSASLTSLAFKFMFSSPDPGWFCIPFTLVMNILQSLFALVLMGLALFFILKSGDVEGRATAKKWAENMIVMIIVLSFSFQIFGMLLNFNTYLTNSLIGQSMSQIFGSSTNPSNAVFAFMLLLAEVSIDVLTLGTLIIRYLLIPVMLMVFPIAIFLYFIPPTQAWGKTLLQIILVGIFMTTADALVMVGVAAMLGSKDPNLLDALTHSFVTVFAFAAIGFVNIGLVLIAVLSVVLQSGAIAGMVGLSFLKGMGGKSEPESGIIYHR